MEEMAKTVCPQCRGTGIYVTTGSNVCPSCKGTGVIDVSSDMFQGCRHNFPPDHVWSTGSGDNVIGNPRTNASSKTLLDEFAMAAMTGVIACPVDSGFVWRDDPTFGEFIASSSFDIAAAMMKERARRDEMGSVKEVE